jgi:hypothetical protein
VGNATFSGDRLEKFLGRVPRTSLEVDIKKTIAYFRKAL